MLLSSNFMTLSVVVKSHSFGLGMFHPPTPMDVDKEWVFPVGTSVLSLWIPSILRTTSVSFRTTPLHSKSISPQEDSLDYLSKPTLILIKPHNAWRSMKPF